MSPITSPTSTSTSSDYAPSSRRKTRVSAEHTLNRVRENQRRHRARQRDRVAFLEERLAETERQLADARREIEMLKAQQEVTSIMCRNEQSILTEDIVPPCDVHEESDERQMEEVEIEIDPYLSSTAYPNTDISNAFTLEINALSLPASQSSLEPSNPPPPGPPPCCSDPIPIPTPQTSPECSTCALQPPPDPSESTTLCSQAFILINQQNVRNLDPELIRGWLRKGLRSAGREGEGCRVENGALLGVLDMLGGF